MFMSKYNFRLTGFKLALIKVLHNKVYINNNLKNSSSICNIPWLK